MVNGRMPSEEHCESCNGWEAEQRRKRLSSPAYNRSRLIRSIDDIFSLLVRIKGNWTCVKCGRTYPPVTSRITGLPAQNIMTNSHFFSRGNYALRWDYDNCDPMDIFCHQKVENHKKDTIEGFNYEEYVKAKIGDQKYMIMEQKAKMTMRYREPQLLEIKERLKMELIELIGYNEGVKIK